MLANEPAHYLLASPDPAYLSAAEAALTASGARVEVVLTAEAARAAMVAPHPPTLALLDVGLPGMEMERLLAAVRSEAVGRRFPILLICDGITREWTERMGEGIVDDLVPRSLEVSFLALRAETVLRNFKRGRELEVLREAAALNAQMDHLTGVFNRETMLSMLFRETDRVQRLKSSLCLILFDIDDFGHWNSRLGSDLCDELLCQVVSRTTRLLRSYDLLGRAGKDEFLLALPGCSSVNAVLLAERLRIDVFCEPFRVAGEAIRMSACFGISASLGRSPVVVLREAEQALEQAKLAGPESIECAGDFPQPTAAPVSFLSPTSGDELLAW